MAEERKLCTGRGSRKKGGGGRFASSVETFPCGALAEHGVEHCTVHLTDLEKQWLRRARADHPFVTAPENPELCGWCYWPKEHEIHGK